MASQSIISLVLALSSFLSTLADNGGFSIDLIHRDSLNSPYYNPLETSAQRLNNAIRRSINRATRFSPSGSISPKTAQSEITSAQGEYLMSVSLGTPPTEILAIADTGSDLIWTQCEPCDDCFKQTDPLFDPNSSKSYRNISCGTSQCQLLEQTSCSSARGNRGDCEYSYSYGDQSFTRGNLAVDTLTLGSTSGRPVSLPTTVFGCGHNNGGSFNANGSGIIGLGGGPVSLISQLGSSIGGKFSYCLVPFSESGNSSKLNFGSTAVLSGRGVQSTTLVSKNPDTFYFLTLEAISVGSKRIPFEGSSFGTTEGNIIIDSGTTLTLLPQDFFTQLASAVDDAVTGQKVDDPSGLLSLCYAAKADLKVPILTVHFNGADVILNPLNTFIQVSDDVVCFAFNPIDSGAIFGNLSQMNFLVAYDLQDKTVSFKPTDCTK